MYFVGVDLAWGVRNPTGIAVIDSHRRLVHVGAFRDDADVLAAVRPYVQGDCLVAFDAPLVVTNPTGQRPAETAFNRDFRRFEAGAHPVNTGKPEFANGPRGARLARALGLDMDPRSSAARRAIEVYPHSATVALFRLPRTLKYKAKPGRGLEQLKSELLLLMDGDRGTRARPGAATGCRSGMGRAAPAGADRAAQERPASCRGSDRRRRVRLCGALCGALPGRRDDLR